MRRGFAQVLPAAGLLLALSASLAYAQQPTRVRGTIERVDGPLLVVRSREGAEVMVRLADNAVVTGLVARSLADIKAGDYVGTAALPTEGGACAHSKCTSSRRTCAAPAKGIGRTICCRRAR